MSLNVLSLFAGIGGMELGLERAGMTTVGSLCSGYGGLDMGLQAALDGGQVLWHAEYDRDASKILAHHWPDVPNLGDITKTDWTAVPRVDWMTAGYPCQPFSHAGKRKGTADERHLWPYVANAIRLVRPRHVLLENVRGHLSLGFGRVLADLAGLGYVGSWVLLRAADVGAPHGRARVFVVASDADSQRLQGGDRDAQAAGESSGTVGCGDGRGTPANPSGDGRQQGWPEPVRLVGRPNAPLGGDGATPDAAGSRREGRAGEYRRQPDVGRGDAGIQATRRGEARTEWGQYGPAIHRWESVLGRVAPAPTEPSRNGGQRLSPVFVEWMQGLPAGHVTGVPGLTRNAQLKALGNGVVPAQAAAAVRILLGRMEQAA